jgi:hypothetical protein
VDAWEGSEDIPAAQTPSLKFSEDIAIRNNIAYFKKIEPNDITLVTKRFDWISGTIYTQWDQTQIMDEQPFYVITDDFNVYKCLHNNFGAESTIKPTGKYLNPFNTSDGYLWKFMYSIPSFKSLRFLTSSFIPVQRSLTDSFYSKGSIESVAILDGGSGYESNQLTEIVVNGTTTGAGASANIVVDELGQIIGISNLIGGSNYNAGVKITVTSSSGENAELTATISGGIITDIVIVNPGYGYLATDTVLFTVGGAVLIPKINSNGSIVDVIVLESGAGYVGTPTLSFNFLPGAITSNIDGLYPENTTAILEAVQSGGEIKRVVIKDPGVGYPINTSTTIIVNGDGNDLILTPVVFNQEIVDVIVENPGFAYTTAILTVNGVGSGAILSAVFNKQDYNSEQSAVEQLAVEGAIYSIVTTTAGNGYTESTLVTITGDGTGATAIANVANDGSIQNITVTNPGSGYSYANIEITDVNRSTTLGSSLIDAAAYAILPPLRGHGYDAVRELYAKTVAISTAIRSDTVVKTLQQDYRQYGILANPRNILSNKLSNVDFDLNMYSVSVVSTTGLSNEQILIQANKYKYRVIYFESNVIWLQPLHNMSVKPEGILVAEDSITSYTIISILTQPLINKYTGNLLYSSNEPPFEFSDTQGISVKTYITF